MVRRHRSGQHLTMEETVQTAKRSDLDRILDPGGASVPPSHVEGAAAAPREKPGAAFDVCIMVKELKTDKSGRTVVEKWVKRKPGDTTPGHQVEVGINVKADTKAS